MKRMLSFFVTLLFIGVLSSCGGDGPNPPASGVFNQSGLYLGIIGFNDDLKSKPIGLLNQSTVSQYKSFVDGLTKLAGTTLYYAEENALKCLKDSKFPNDLESVSIVTFTDGVDQGSNAYNDSYSSAKDYLNAVSSSIRQTYVDGKQINAYAIGLRGNDVKTDEQINLFRENLAKLSSSEQNRFEVSNMDQVNSTFKKIASSLYKSSSVHILSISIPSLYDGNPVRFTFDNVASGEQSQCYIEGVWQSGKLTNLKAQGCLYKGDAMVVGEKVTGTQYKFTFRGLSATDNGAIQLTHLMEYYKTSADDKWTPNSSEFDKNRDAEQKVEQKTAVVMLVLDCSSSLGDDFQKMKSAAKDFISLLVNSSNQNSSGSSSSSSPSYDETGDSNGYSYVDLGLSVKWATCNVGANAPEEYGDYFAWGEISPKSSYSSSNYSYSNNPSILPMSADAANANWGGTWRMPTRAEQDELRTQCTWTWTTQNGVQGYTVNSRTNGNSIFLPAAGYRDNSDLYGAGSFGCYWSSSVYYSSRAYYLYFYVSSVDWDNSSRYYGQSVRPVLP